MKKNISLKGIFGILCFIVLVLFGVLLSTHSYPNDSTIPIIIMVFWGFIVLILYICYIKFHKKYLLILINLIITGVTISIINGILYEYHINKLHIGMERVQVKILYGTGTSGLGYGSNGLGSADCLKCNGESYQFSYDLKSNLWYSNLEHTYYVCYIDEVVCDYERSGL